jgi:hypothetical protein
MKTKPILQVLAVCFSVTLLSGYVIYAQRRAQPAPVSQPSPESAAGDQSDGIVQIASGNPPPAKPVMASSSKRISTVFTPDIVSTPSNPSPVLNHLLPIDGSRQSLEIVSRRTDGNSVTTRVSEFRAPVLAPSSKSMVGVFPSTSVSSPATRPIEEKGSPASNVTLPGGTTVRPETIQHGNPPALLGVISPANPPPPPVPPLPPAPVPAAPTQPPRTLISSTKSAPVFTAPAPTAPRPIQSVNPPANPPQPRMIAPGSKSIDLLLFQKGTAPAPTAPVIVPAPIAPRAPQSAPTPSQGQSTRSQQAPTPKAP